MIFTFTDEQTDLAAILRRFLQDKSPSAEVRRLMQPRPATTRRPGPSSPGSSACRAW